MSPHKQSEVVQALETSRRELQVALEGLSDEQAKLPPGPGRWSVLECLEHIVIAERRFVGWLENPESAPPPPANKEKETALVTQVSSRERKAQAPPPGVPTGRFTTLAEATRAFDTARAHSIAFATEKGSQLYSLCARHPFFDLLNGTELMLMMAAHCRRHIAQIRETRSELPIQ